MAVVNTSDCRNELSHAGVRLCEVSNQQSAKSFIIVQSSEGSSECKKMFEFLKERDPFYINTVLINLNSDEVADESVNVFQTQAMGESLIQGIVGL